MEGAQLKISFIVPLLNEKKTISLCLDSIIHEMADNDEIIVVDNGSTDGSKDIVKNYAKMHERLLLMNCPSVNIAAVRNAGARIANGHLLAFVDADCILCPKWRTNAINTFKEAPVSATGSKVDLPSYATWIEKAWFSQRKKKSGKVKYINSGNLVVKKRDFDAVGGFNESLVTGEDSELCWRLNKNGHLVYENPLVKAIHFGNPKNIRAFYRQQRWHAIGMTGTLMISWIDKPFFMTVVFLFCLIASASSIIFFLVNDDSMLSFLNSLIPLFLAPIAASLYRMIQYHIYIYFFPHLIILYFVYFLARTDALFRITFLKGALTLGHKR